MNDLDFSLMSDAQLRAYVLENRDNLLAFQIYVDRKAQQPPVAIIEPEEWSEERMKQVLDEIKQRQQN
jgi:hypothetical protein